MWDQKPFMFIYPKATKIMFGTIKKKTSKESWIIDTNERGESTIRTAQKPSRYLYVYKGELKLKSSTMNLKGHKWKIEDHKAYSKIQNLSKPNLYIHMEKGQPSVGEALEGWHSTRWKIKE